MVVEEQKLGNLGAVLDGKLVSKAVRQEVKTKVDAHLAKGKRAPGLAVVLVGDDAASAIYVKNKIQACKQTGIESFFHKFEAAIAETTIIECIKTLNQDPCVDGILVQLPLPKHISTDAVLEVLAPEKDVDGLGTHSLGLLLAGKPGLRPCTPSGVIKLLDHYNVEIAGKNAVVIGRSILVGKPAAMLLMERNATVTVCHSKTRDLDQICRSADILVVAAGRKEFVKGSWIKPGSCVIDVGIHRTELANGESQLCGDVEYNEAATKAALITPVPGGVGPMTIAMLLSNTLLAYEMKDK